MLQTLMAIIAYTLVSIAHTFAILSSGQGQNIKRSFTSWGHVYFQPIGTKHREPGVYGLTMTIIGHVFHLFHTLSTKTN